MKNQFMSYKLMTILAKTKQGYVKMDKMLVDLDNQQFIYCSYSLRSAKDVSTSEVDCRIIKTPMTLLPDNSVEVEYNDVVTKLNRKNTKKVGYDELAIAFDIANAKENKFSVFM